MSPIQNRNRVILIVAVFCALLAGLAWQRYQRGLNYLPVHIKVSGPSDSAPFDQIRVHTRSPFGTFGELTQDPDEPGLFRAPWSTPVSDIVVSAPAHIDWTPLTFEVRASEFWVGPSRRLQILDQESTESPIEGLVGLRLKPGSIGRSILFVSSQTINWQGDLMLLLIPALGAVSILALLWLFVLLFRHSWRIAKMEAATRGGLAYLPVILRWILSGMCCAALLAALHHLILQYGALRAITDGIQFVVAIAVLAAIGSGTWWLARWSAVQGSPQSVDRMAIIVLAGIVALKIAWVSMVDTVQTGDYGIYWKIACWMAGGEWERALETYHGPLQTFLIQRAVPWYFIVASVFGPSQSGLELANVGLQGVTMVLFYILVRHMFNPRVALIALPLVAVFPPFWFSVTTASHDVPAMFLLLVFWWLVEGIRGLLDSPRWYYLNCSSRKRAAFGLGLALAAGVVCGAAEIQRSYGVFMIGSFVVAAGYFGTSAMRSPSERPLMTFFPASHIHLLWFGATALFFGGYFLTIRLADDAITRHFGILEKSSVAAYLSSVDSTTDGSYDTMHPWRFFYYPEVPATEKSGLLLRKMAFEKLGRGITFWEHAYRKNGALASYVGVIYAAHGGVEGRFAADHRLVSWHSAKLMVSHIIVAVLLVLFIFRLLLITRFPIGVREVFPVLFCCVSYGILILLTETAGVYNIFLGFPLAWNGALVVAEICD